jgi:hypothetical protein
MYVAGELFKSRHQSTVIWSVLPFSESTKPTVSLREEPSPHVIFSSPYLASNFISRFHYSCPHHNANAAQCNHFCAHNG